MITTTKTKPKAMTMFDVLKRLAAHQQDGKTVSTDDNMQALADALDFDALAKGAFSHRDLVTVSVYLGDMAEAGIVPRDLQYIRPMLTEAKEARHHLFTRKVFVYS